MSDAKPCGEPRLQRWVLQIEYDGTPYVGWQSQADRRSVQSTLEAAITRLEGRRAPLTCAGRTDAGVHATGQVAHVELARVMTPEKLVAALNYHLKPDPIAVLRAALVPPSFSARFSAIGRTYRYRILNRPARAALLARQVWHLPRLLDIDAMQQAANHLIGRHDFTSFRAAACQANSPIRTLDLLSVTKAGEIVEVMADARSFLHHQVRNMVGTLRLVGEGGLPADTVAHILAARTRAAAGPTAPPDGLCLIAVRYPSDPFDEHAKVHGDDLDQARG